MAHFLAPAFAFFAAFSEGLALEVFKFMELSFATAPPQILHPLNAEAWMDEDWAWI